MDTLRDSIVNGIRRVLARIRLAALTLRRVLPRVQAGATSGEAWGCPLSDKSPPQSRPTRAIDPPDPDAWRL